MQSFYLLCEEPSSLTIKGFSDDFISVMEFYGIT